MDSQNLFYGVRHIIYPGTARKIQHGYFHECNRDNRSVIPVVKYILVHFEKIRQFGRVLSSCGRVRNAWYVRAGRVGHVVAKFCKSLCRLSRKVLAGCGSRGEVWIRCVGRCGAGFVSAG